MTPASHTPVYNVKAVVKETGLTPDTLRAWERRYGVLSPQRSPGGHRVYSQHDIELLKWLVARRQEGVSISRAVEMWAKLAERGPEPALPGSAPYPQVAPNGHAPDALRAAWVDRCMAFDEHGAEAVVSQGFAMYTPEQVCTEIIQQGVTTLGDQWYHNRASVQQVSFATQLGSRRLDALLESTPAPTRAARILLGCPPEEQHTFGALLFALLLRWQGWEVLYLGPNLPLEHLGETLAGGLPDLVVLSAQQLITAANLVEMAQAVSRNGFRVAYGGRIFNLAPRVRPRIAGHFLGESLAGALAGMESLIYNPPALPAPELPTDPYRVALAHYRPRQSLIEADVQEVADTVWSHGDLQFAKFHLTRGIVAALALGDMTLLDNEVDWLAGLLSHYDVSPGVVRQLLSAMNRSARTHLDERGQVILDWLSWIVDRFS